MGEEPIEEWDPDNPKYIHLIYYRHEEYYGTWIGASESSSAKLILNPDGTFQEYLLEISVEPSMSGTITVVDKWNDSVGNIWYKVKFQNKGLKVGYELVKISNNGSTMEHVFNFTGSDFPTEIDPDHSNYQIFHCQ